MGVAALALATSATRAQKAGPPPQAKETKETRAGAAFPKIWKSQATTHEYRVRIEKDTFYAEWVNRPPDAVKKGLYIRSVCRRAGDKWVGTSRVLLACTKPGPAGGKATNVCNLTVRFEVDSITPERISGRGETLKNFDCEKCQVLRTGWADFVWVPK